MQKIIKNNTHFLLNFISFNDVFCRNISSKQKNNIYIYKHRGDRVNQFYDGYDRLTPVQNRNMPIKSVI